MDHYTKIIIIGSPGSGKSTLSLKLSKILNLPVIHLDNLFWHADKTTISSKELENKIASLCQNDSWIIDGNYTSSLPLRLSYNPLVIFLDYDTDVCLESIIGRIGKKRVDLPWIETEIDPEFMQYVKDFNKDQKPIIEKLIKDHTVIRFNSRKQCDLWLASLNDTVI